MAVIGAGHGLFNEAPSPISSGGVAFTSAAIGGGAVSGYGAA